MCERAVNDHLRRLSGARRQDKAVPAPPGYSSGQLDPSASLVVRPCRQTRPLRSRYRREVHNYLSRDPGTARRVGTARHGAEQSARHVTARHGRVGADCRARQDWGQTERHVKTGTDWTAREDWGRLNGTGRLGQTERHGKTGAVSTAREGWGAARCLPLPLQLEVGLPTDKCHLATHKALNTSRELSAAVSRGAALLGVRLPHATRSTARVQTGRRFSQTQREVL